MTISRCPAQDGGESRLPQAPALSPPPVSPLAVSGAVERDSQLGVVESVPPTVLPVTVTLVLLPSGSAVALVSPIKGGGEGGGGGGDGG